MTCFRASGRSLKKFASPRPRGTSLKLMGAMTAKDGDTLVLAPGRDRRSLEDLVLEILPQLGEDPNREGLQRTPARVAKALQFLTSGYQADIGKLVNEALYSVKHDEMVIVKGI